MNPLASRLLKVCAALLAAGGSVAASTQATPPPESALAAAKRDYRALEELSGVAREHGTPGSSRRSLPPLETAPDSRPVLSPMQRARKAAADKAGHGTERSKTWLIDALRENTASQSTRPGEATFEPESEEAGARMREDQWISRQDNAQQRGPALKETRLDDAATRTSSSVINNPLDGYMSKWMTARDFDLLRSRSEPNGQGSAAPLLGAVSDFDLVSLPPLAETRITGVESPLDRSSLRRVATNENPYLEALALIAPQIPQSAFQASPPQLAPVLVPLIQPRPVVVDEVAPPPEKALTSEFLKAQDDARYFKQLKRF